MTNPVGQPRGGSPSLPTCVMDDGGVICGRHLERDGCSVHAFAGLHQGHRILVNGHGNRWCDDCDEWVEFDAYREEATRA